jgi:16S rRNA A1518/A1519 N6-dimethyltransferase RsmA/KsgA/DIM1 with predicted DNA glycosylase/AP lyase activity
MPKNRFFTEYVSLCPTGQGRAPPGYSETDAAAFLRFVSLAFQHKRKTLRNNLVEQYDRAVLDALPEGRLRAEQMGIEALLELYRRLH